MYFNNIFENQIFSLHICLCTPKNKAFFEMRLLNANLKCTCTQNLRECLTFSHCAVRDIFARARKGFMTKMVWRPRCTNLIDLIVGTYVKSLKALLPLHRSHTCVEAMRS